MAQVAGESIGTVLAVEPGVVEVSSRGRHLRATIGAELLCRMARDSDEGPWVGDRVLLRTWADGPVTVETILARALHRASGEGAGT